MLLTEHSYVSGGRWLCFEGDMAMLNGGDTLMGENVD